MKKIRKKRSLGWGEEGKPGRFRGEEEDSDVSEEEHDLYVREEERANVNMILRQLGVTPREEDMDSQEIEEEY